MEALPQMDFVTAFVGLSMELLDGLLEVFPECKKTAVAKGQLQDLLNVTSVQEAGKMIITRWHKHLEPYYTACDQKNVAVLLAAKVKPLEEIDMAAKWADPDIDEETRQHLLDYLIQLNNYARLYHRIPSNMMSRVGQISQTLVQKMMSGNFSGINLEELGQQAVDGIPPEELEMFTNNAADIQSIMQNMMSSMSPEAAGLAQSLDPAMMSMMMGQFSANDMSLMKPQ